MSTPPPGYPDPPGHVPSPEHLDLDTLADVLAGEPIPTHLAACAACTTDLAELRAASATVASALSALPALSLPEDVAARLAPAMGSAMPIGGTVTTLPTARDRVARQWLPAAAAVVLLLAGAGYGLSRLGSSDGASSTSSAAGAKAAGPAGDVVRNNTGTDYTNRATLAFAVPSLLSGTAQDAAARDTTAQAPAPAFGAPNRAVTGGTATGGTPAGPEAQSQAVADPLARLRDNAGLADCLLALLPPEDPSARPLALDYASFRGRPALIVVLPSSLPRKLDVFVVGPSCSRANDSTLFYTSVDKP